MQILVVDYTMTWNPGSSFILKHDGRSQPEQGKVDLCITDVASVQKKKPCGMCDIDGKCP